MIDLEISLFNPTTASENDWKKYHTFRKLRHDETSPNLPTVSNTSYEETLKQTPQRLNILRFNVFEKNNLDTQIGEIYFSYYKDGTDPDACMVNISVASSHRHHGIGVQLLKKLADLAKENNKTRIVFQSTEEEGMKVIEHFNAQKISEQEQFRLKLAETNWEVINNWLAETKPILSNVTLEWIKVVNEIPNEVLEQYIRIFSSVFDEHPKFHVGNLKGSKDMPIGALKHDIKQFNKKGGKWILGLIKERNGDVSGLTELKWSPTRPEVLLQFITHIKLKYRGSGKGKLIKAQSMQYIKDTFPDIKYIHTGFVGDKNSPLYKINEKIGFKLFYHSASYEILTAELEKWTAEHVKMH